MNLQSYLSFPAGIDLVEGALAGEARDRDTLKSLMESAMAGAFDGLYANALDPDRIEVTASLHLLTLELLADNFSIHSEAFYKGDPLRYVRTNLFIQWILGIRKLTLGWPVYAFGAEGLGQKMMYPERHAPGSDPVDTLIDRDTWPTLATPNFGSGIYVTIKEMLGHFADLTGLPPVAHLPAPYSLSAEIYGQERLILDVSTHPDVVRDLVDHLTDHVFVPWIDDLAETFDAVWIELSDASGSPMFIGPGLLRDVAARPVRRLISDYPWGNRVFVANYRGDHLVATAGRRGGARHRGRKQRREASARRGGTGFDSLPAMIDFKLSICPQFAIRLEADEAPLKVYTEKAIENGTPLYLGVGAAGLDRNRVPDIGAAAVKLREKAETYIVAVKRVSEALTDRGRPRRDLDWPGDIYFEDINAQTAMPLVRTVIETVRERGLCA